MLTRIVGVLAWVTIMYVVVMGVSTGKKGKPKLEGCHIFEKPVLALEFADTDADVKAVVDGKGHPAWLHKMLRLDYGFVALHLLLFLSLCLMLWQTGSRTLRVVAVAAALGTLTLAASNIVQNIRLAHVIDEARLVEDVDMLGYLKWSLTFAVIGSMSLFFFQSDGWVKGLGAVCLLIFVAGAAGLAGVCVKLSPKPLWLIELAFVLIGLLLVAVAVTFTFFPRKIAGAG